MERRETLLGMNDEALCNGSFQFSVYPNIVVVLEGMLWGRQRRPVTSESVTTCSVVGIGLNWAPRRSGAPSRIFKETVMKEPKGKRKGDDDGRRALKRELNDTVNRMKELRLQREQLRERAKALREEIQAKRAG